MSHERFWIGDPPDLCELKSERITDTFIDGRVQGGGWANMCPECHRLFGSGLGMGFGQRYEKQADGRWKKTEG